MKKEMFSASMLYFLVFSMFSFTMIFLFTLYMRLPAYLIFFKRFKVETPFITNMYLMLSRKLYDWGMMLNVCIFLGLMLSIVIILVFRDKNKLFKPYTFGVGICMALVFFAEGALTLPVIRTMSKAGAAITPFSIGLAKSAIERREAGRFFVPAYLKGKLKNIEEKKGFVFHDKRA